MTDGWRFLVVTAFDTNYEVGFLCSVVNEAYCQRNGYSFRRLLLSPAEMQGLAAGRHLAWGKVALLEELVSPVGPTKTETSKVLGKLRHLKLDFDYIVWIDADAMVLDHSILLDHFVELAEGADFIIGEDMADTDLLNTGLMLFRRSPWCHDLLRRWWNDSDEKWHHQVCWDQTGLCRLLSQDGFGREQPWFSWAGGLQYKRADHVFVLDCGSFNFKYLNNCSFVFHAVGERELLLSFTRGLLLKKDRLYRAVQDGFVVHGQDVISSDVLETSLDLLPESEVSGSKVSLENALHFWRRFGVGKSSKKSEAPPLGWGLSKCAWSGRQLPTHHLMLGPMKLESAWISHRSLDPSYFARHLGDVPVRLLRPQVDKVESFATRLWQLCSYMSGNLPPFSPLGFTTAKPWRLWSWDHMEAWRLLDATWRSEALQARCRVMAPLAFWL